MPKFRRRRKRSPSTSSTSTSSPSFSTSETTSHSFEINAYSELRAQLASSGLILRDVPSDGNCLFSAFSDQLYGATSYHARLRREAVTYLHSHRNEIQPYCEARCFASMVRELSEPGTYGDHTSLVALARIYRVNVVVHRLKEIPRLVARGDQHANESDHLPQVHVAFHEDIEHYSSVRLWGEPLACPALVETDLLMLEKLAKPSRWLAHNFHLRHRRGKLTFHLQRPVGR